MSTGRVKPTPILRLKNKAEFHKIPEELRKAIAKNLDVKWAEENFEIKEIAQDEKYSSHYIDRIHSINDSAKFLLDSYKDIFPLGEKLKNYLDKITEECEQQIQSISTHNIHLYQNSLANYTDYVIKILKTELDLSKSSVEKQLEKAEAFALALKPKPAICTIINYLPESNQKDKRVHSIYIAMVDKPENPFTKETLEDLSLIHTRDRHLPYWKSEIPWYKGLAAYEKRFLHHLIATVGPENISTTVNALPSKLRLVPAVSNYGTHTLITYSKNRDVKVHTPEKRSSHTASRDVVKRHADPIHDLLAEEVLVHVRRNTQKEIDDIIAEKKAELEEAFKNNNKLPKKIIIPILYQTLVSPTVSPDAELNSLKEQMVWSISNELAEKNQVINGVEIEFQIISTNHPLNEGKYARPTTFWLGYARAQTQLFTLIKNHPNPLLTENEKALLIKVKDHLRTCVSDAVPEIFNSHRELYISSLEQIVVGLAGGASMGSCISGKDRKAIEIAHTDAMRNYFDIYGELPPLGPHPAFDKIFAEIFCTNHQQTLASQNVSGSFGIKTPMKYLPEHLQKAVKDWYQANKKKEGYKHVNGEKKFSDSDLMASNNEIKKIKVREATPKECASQVWTKPKEKMNRNKIYFSSSNDKESEMQEFINKACWGIENHQNDKKMTLPKSPILLFFSQSCIGSHCERSTLRAKTYQALFTNDQLSVEKKFFLLGALLLSNDGENLQSFVCSAMGFYSLNAARKAFIGYFRSYIDNVTDKSSKEAIRIILRYILRYINNIHRVGQQDYHQNQVIEALDNVAKINSETPGRTGSELSSRFF